MQNNFRKDSFYEGSWCFLKTWHCQSLSCEHLKCDALRAIIFLILPTFIQKIMKKLFCISTDFSKEKKKYFVHHHFPCWRMTYFLSTKPCKYTNSSMISSRLYFQKLLSQTGAAPGSTLGCWWVFTLLAMVVWCGWKHLLKWSYSCFKWTIAVCCRRAHWLFFSPPTATTHLSW